MCHETIAYLITGKQVSHEYAYPYANTQPKLTCQNKGYWNPGAKIDEAIVDYNCDDTKIKQLVYQYGSAVIGLYAGDHGFDNYVSGVFDTCRYYYVLFNNQYAYVKLYTVNAVIDDCVPFKLWNFQAVLSLSFYLTKVQI